MPQRGCSSGHGLCSVACSPAFPRPARPVAPVPACTVLGFRDPGVPVTQELGRLGPGPLGAGLPGAMLPAAHSTGRGWRERQPGHESGALGDPVPSSPAEVEGRPLPGGTPFLRETWTLSRFLPRTQCGMRGKPLGFQPRFLHQQNKCVCF